MNLLYNFFLFLIFTFFLINCQSEQVIYYVKVNSIGESTEFKKYFLLPGNKDTSVDDLQFKEFADYIHRALQNNGFIPVNKMNDADIAVIFTYAIGDPKENQYSYNVPVWGQTGVSSSSTYGKLNSSGNYSSNTYNTPSYGITGSTTHVGSYITYKRFMNIEAIDMKKYLSLKKVILAWKTSVSSEGYSADLRRVLPVMVVGASPYLGKNSGNLIEINILEDDRRIQEIKGLQKPENE